MMFHWLKKDVLDYEWEKLYEAVHINVMEEIETDVISCGLRTSCRKKCRRKNPNCKRKQTEMSLLNVERHCFSVIKIPKNFSDVATETVPSPHNRVTDIACLSSVRGLLGSGNIVRLLQPGYFKHKVSDTPKISLENVLSQLSDACTSMERDMAQNREASLFGK
ncbi:hypothetical protein AVEN_166195-1 [Araneus ventricosus]|uniref:Uncharacterized protein n=1 Tax=Araneus ventricosus TaxID=182803 RepID=A0A4Y2DBB5_ARAVE|nr:hypothetical protein AVEN_166195-1 [Araneus ventricosus]